MASQVGLGGAVEWTWKIVQWPVVFLPTALVLALVNYFGPNAEQDWTWVTPGAVLATALWSARRSSRREFAVLVPLRLDVTGSLKAVVRSTTQPRQSRAMQPARLRRNLAEIRRTLTEREREEHLRLKQLRSTASVNG